MVVPTLSSAQRALAEKGLAVQRARQEKENQKALLGEQLRKAHHPPAASPSLGSRSDAPAGDGARRGRHQDRSLIIRHVGEALARVALKEEKSRPKQPITAPARLANPPAPDASKNGCVVVVASPPCGSGWPRSKSCTALFVDGIQCVSSLGSPALGCWITTTGTTRSASGPCVGRRATARPTYGSRYVPLRCSRLASTACVWMRI